ncbi:HAMP domain-containing protein [Candidatus Woesearchaeota archaeon]|nr:HAMP domain-containing protein [Candidatus Woesearchaeota archaeon]
MKIKYLIFVIILTVLIVNSAALIMFTNSNIAKISDVTTQSSSDELENIAGSNIEDIAIGIRDSVDDQMGNQYDMVKSWVQAPVLIDAAITASGMSKEDLYEDWSASATRVYDEGEATGDGNPDNDVSPEASRFLMRLVAQTPYPELFITDSRGYAIAASAATGDFDQGPDDWRVFLENGAPVYKKHGPSPGGEGWYKAANEAADGFFVEPVEFDESSRTWGIAIMKQIRNPTTNAYLGQIKAQFDYGTFIKGFVDANKYNVAEILVVDQDGTLVATSAVDQSAVNNDAITVSNMGFFSEVRRGKTNGYSFDRDLQGDQALVGYAVSGDVNKHVVVVVKKLSDVKQPIYAFITGIRSNINDIGSSLIQNVMLIALLLGIVTLLVAYYVSTQQISAPIEELTVAARKVGRGEFDVSLPMLKAKNEVTELTSAMELVLAGFKSMKKK